MDCFNSPGGTDAYQPQTNAVQSGVKKHKVLSVSETRHPVKISLI